MTEESPPESAHHVRHAVVWIGGLAALVQISVFTFPVAVASWRQEPWVRELLANHFPAIVGLPSAALASFLIIAAFEARFDRIKMRLGTFVEFTGAAGPIVLWILCFTAMSMGIKLVW
ncbi:hypothetical protein [Amycolatopsis sp. cg9]|uniref:hypothetical protein n=1 Tax=Amycolatopsis sp. cg9 TaxID=3238801 RepID=UPI003524F9DD